MHRLLSSGSSARETTAALLDSSLLDALHSPRKRVQDRLVIHCEREVAVLFAHVIGSLVRMEEISQRSVALRRISLFQ